MPVGQPVGQSVAVSKTALCQTLASEVLHSPTSDFLFDIDDFVLGKCGRTSLCWGHMLGDIRAILDDHIYTMWLNQRFEIIRVLLPRIAQSWPMPAEVKPKLAAYGSVMLDVGKVRSTLEGFGLNLDEPRCYEAAHNLFELLGHLGLGRGTLIASAMRGGRSEDPRCVFASPDRPFMPAAVSETALHQTLAVEVPHLPPPDILVLDIDDPVLGKRLAFLERVGFPPVIFTHIFAIDIDSNPRIHVNLLPPLPTGTRLELLSATGLQPESSPASHDTGAFGPAQVPAKTMAREDDGSGAREGMGRTSPWQGFCAVCCHCGFMCAPWCQCVLQSRGSQSDGNASMTLASAGRLPASCTKMRRSHCGTCWTIAEDGGGRLNRGAPHAYEYVRTGLAWVWVGGG